MRGGIFSEVDETHGDARDLGNQQNRNRPQCFEQKRFGQDPENGQQEQVIDDVGHAIEAAQAGIRYAEPPRQDAVENVGKRAHNQNRQIDQPRRSRERANQCGRTEQQAERRQKEWSFAFPVRSAIDRLSQRRSLHL